MEIRSTSFARRLNELKRRIITACGHHQCRQRQSLRDRRASFDVASQEGGCITAQHPFAVTAATQLFTPDFDLQGGDDQFFLFISY